ncbi:MAG TPA: hypothetical protein VEA60_15025 [Allosphingosinicella sp.]|nr:hypothetical protein [Allosphingosinicella sp.]
MRLYPDQFPQAVGDLLGIVHYVKVTLGAVKAERVDEAAKGVERVMEAADKVKPSPLIARIQTAVLGELASLQAKRSDPAVALRTARRLEQLARRHDHPDMTILAATTQATAYAALGDAAAVRNQWVEKHKLCSLLPDGVPADDPFADEMVEALATCEAAEETETRAVRSHFETRVAELERGGAPELAETVFYLAAALERARDMEGSKTAYRRAIALKTQSAPARAPSLDPTAFAMARLGGLERDRESLSKVRAWLERERGRRPLAAEEERLLAYAKWTAVRETQ